MEIEVDFNKTAQENADAYYKKSKKMLLKIEGAKKAIKELERQLNAVESDKNKVQYIILYDIYGRI